MFCESERRKSERLCDLIENIDWEDGVLLFADPDGQLCNARSDGAMEDYYCSTLHSDVLWKVKGILCRQAKESITGNTKSRLCRHCNHRLGM